MYTQRTPSSFSRSLHLLFFFFTFLTFSHLDFPAGGGRKHSGPQDKFFRSFFFCFSTCCFPRQALIFSPFSFWLALHPFILISIFFSFFLFLSPCLLFLFSFRYFFSHHPPPSRHFLIRFSQTALSICRLFFKRDYFFSLFLKYRLDLFISFK